jgi:hypothetical protein
MLIKEVVSIREVSKEDLNFILSSSVSCLSKYTESIFKGMNHDDIYAYLNTFIVNALHRLNYSIFIACHKDDTNHIIGYIVADTSTNYIFLQYTKFNYRKLGVQSNLLMPLVVDKTKPIITAWPTKEMLKLKNQGKMIIANKTILELIVKE